MDLPLGLGEDLLRYLFSTSKERARIIAEMTWRNPPTVDLLMDPEAAPTSERCSR